METQTNDESIMNSKNPTTTDGQIEPQVRQLPGIDESVLEIADSVRKISPIIEELGYALEFEVDGFQIIIAKQKASPLDWLVIWQNILSAEGLGDWTVKEIHSGGGLTVFKTKEIWLDTKYLNNIFWFLHEVAHILYPNHESMWGNHFTRLLDKYIKADSSGVITQNELSSYTYSARFVLSI